MRQDYIPIGIVKPTIEGIKEQFIEWRSNKSHRDPIPEGLWESAVSLAGEHSIGKISNALSLSHRDLKRRVQAHSDKGCQEAGGSYHFVEFAVNKPESDTECVVEMEDHKGGKLKVHMKDGIGFNLLEVAKAFWKRDL